MLNQAILIGRLTRDPELKQTASGISVGGFTLACDRPYTNDEGNRETDFLPIVVWKKQAENCATYLNKGSMVAVTGRIQVRSYENKNGDNVKVTEIVADNVRFLEPKPKSPPVTQTSTMNSAGLIDEDVPF